MFRDSSEVVLLGVPGSVADSIHASDPRRSRIGGEPCWHDPTTSARDDLLVCAQCQERLDFIVQVYAPTEVDRSLYFYACRKRACTLTRNGWRVFRNQQSASTRQSVPPPPSIPAVVQQSKSSGIDWASLNDVCLNLPTTYANKFFDLS